jgi:hypothetical protein
VKPSVQTPVLPQTKQNKTTPKTRTKKAEMGKSKASNIKDCQSIILCTRVKGELSSSGCGLSTLTSSWVSMGLRENKKGNS